MVNNIGKTSKELNTNLGETTSFTSKNDVNLITGELGIGVLLFDPNGTLGVISSFASEENFTITTYALSIDINKILSMDY